MAAGGETRNPLLRLEQQPGGGSSQRAGDEAQHIEAGQIGVGFKIAEHLPGNLGMIEAVLGVFRELIERPAEFLAVLANNPHQRHIFRQPARGRHRQAQSHFRFFIFHSPQYAPPGRTLAVQPSK